jgi:hypothetical protein
MACHEFPFFATEQGFQGAAQDPAALPKLSLIAAANNSGQGSRYGTFTQVCKMKEQGETRPSTAQVLEHGDPFIALPIALRSFPTVWTLCNGKTE